MPSELELELELQEVTDKPILDITSTTGSIGASVVVGKLLNLDPNN